MGEFWVFAKKAIVTSGGSGQPCMIGVIWGLVDCEDCVVKVGELDDGNKGGRVILLSLQGLQNCSSS